jgi:hypothetical protein
MDRTTPIRTDADESVDDWIDALRSEQEYWGAKMDAVARATIRIMGRSDTEYTLANLINVFEDAAYRREVIEHETQTTDTEAHGRDLDTLAIEDEALFRRLADTDTTTTR